MRLRAALAVSVAFVSVNAFAYDAHAKPYKGAEVYGRDPVLHGRVEARMRMASGSGVLTTLFLYKDGSEKAGAYWEEIDVEIFGKDNASSWQSNIIWGQPRSTAEEVHTHPTSLAEAYHTYTVEWTPTSLSWRLDGVEVRRADGAGPAGLTNPQTIRFNLWISDSPAWAGALDPAALPTYQFVNWVKYYRYEDGEFILDWTDDFDTFDTKRWGKANWTWEENLADLAPANALVRDGTLVLALTTEASTGFAGEVPKDDDTSGSTSGSSGSATSGSTGGSSDGGVQGTSGATASGRSGSAGGTGKSGTSGSGDQSGAGTGAAGASGRSGAGQGGSGSATSGNGRESGSSGETERSGASHGSEDSETRTSSGGGCALAARGSDAQGHLLLGTAGLLLLWPLRRRRSSR